MYFFAFIILFAISLVTIIVAPIAFACMVIYEIKMIRSAKPGVKLWSRQLMYNPCNIVFCPDLLTEEGLFYRKKLGISVLRFVIPILITILLGSLLGIAK